MVRSSSDSGAPAIEKAPAADAPTASDASPDSNGVTPVEASPELEYVERSAFDRSIASLRLAFALPWRRFKGGSALVFKLGGAIPEEPQSRFSQVTSLPAICECLRKAAHDPRINGVVFKIDPLSVGWAKVIEIRRHLEYFRKSGKWTVAYMERAGEKEYYLASAFEEIYAPPCASLSLRGLSVAGTFLRGVLEKVGVEPEVRRIGKYKSAGDQLLRSDMSEPQREQLSALLDDIYGAWLGRVCPMGHAWPAMCLPVSTGWENSMNCSIYGFQDLWPLMHGEGKPFVLFCQHCLPVNPRAMKPQAECILCATSLRHNGHLIINECPRGGVASMQSVSQRRWLPPAARRVKSLRPC